MSRKNYKKTYYNDIALSLASRVLNVRHLHFGYFDESLKPSMQNLYQAQENYVSQLEKHIPAGVHHVFDVGCGTGGLAGKLIEKGFAVTCLAPDSFLIEKTKTFTQNQVTTLTAKYEDLNGAFYQERKNSFDLILMSESCQYIDVESGWAQNKHFLHQDKGYVLVSDFFKIKEIDCDFISKSGHDLDLYLSCAQKNGFQLLTKKDITANIIGTMEIYSDMIGRYGFPIVEALGKIFERRFPFLYKMFLFAFKKKIHKLEKKILPPRRRDISVL